MASDRQLARREIQRRKESGAWRYIEPALTIGSSIIAEPLSGLAGLAALGSGKGADVVRSVQEGLTYSPRTEAGKQGLRDLSYTLEPVADALSNVSSVPGDYVFEATGSPGLAAAAYSAPTALMEAFGLKGLKASGALDKGRKFEIGDIGTQASPYGGKQRGVFAGVKAKGADLDAMEAAKELQSRGVSRDEIWSKTGWFEDVDGKWKWEIDDSAARVITPDERTQLINRRYSEIMDDPKLDDFDKEVAVQQLFENAEKGADVLEGNLLHDPLYQAYPKTRDIEADINFAGDESGYFSAKENKIFAQKAGDPTDVALHETQHAIQDIEGFAKGGRVDQLWPDKDIMDLKIDSKEVANANALSRMSRGAEKPLTSESDLNIDRFKMMMGREPTANEKWLATTYSPNYLIDQRKMLKAIEDINFKKTMAASDYKQGKISIDEFYKRSEVTPQEIQFKLYEQLAGEAEARNVQKRMNMTPEERAKTPPWETLDIPEREQIVR